MARPPGDIFPPPERLLEMDPEEIAGFLLEYLNQFPKHNHVFHLGNLTGSAGAFVPYAGVYFQRVIEVIAEAWGWLMREGMIAERPEAATHGFVFVTRRGQNIRLHADLEAYRRAAILHDEVLEPSLSQKVVSLFRQGDYDTAVFAAFKEIEVRVREVGDFTESDLGVSLMRQAFGEKAWRLTDKARDPGEKVATMETFAGAIGLFKNPSSHRNVALSATEAAALIYFANYLLGIVESRRPPKLGPRGK